MKKPCVLLFLVLAIVLPVYLSAETYRVQQGDTLWGIARRFSVSVEALQRANATGSTLLPGTLLNIPRSGAPAAEQTQNYSWYTVQNGDSLWALARRHKTTEAWISSMNNLSSGNLYAGQRIKVPPASGESAVAPAPARAAPAASIYVVQNGDSLWTLSRKFNTTEQQLRQLNNLSGSSIFVGQRLKVPGAASPQQSAPAQALWQRYTVKAGESLWLLASRHKTSIDVLRDRNKLRSDNLLSGQTIEVPVAAQNSGAQDVWKQQHEYFGRIPAGQRLAFRWPVRGQVVESFGVKSQWINNGITIKTPPDWAVNASQAGLVTFAGEQRGYGNMVIIRHQNEIYTVYTNLSRIFVQKDRNVNTGERIGATGYVPSASTHGVHFQMYYQTSPVDPQSYLQG